MRHAGISSSVTQIGIQIYHCAGNVRKDIASLCFQLTALKILIVPRRLGFGL